LIDIGQGVLLSHPNAKDFFDRDIRNVSAWFSKNGLKKTAEEVLADIRLWKKRL
jgi:serine/threonine-protein kinase RIO1